MHAIFRFILAITLLIPLFALAGENEEWKPYLAWHSSGQISTQADIRIRFAKELPDALINEKRVQALLSISPDIAVNIRFDARQGIIISPKKAWVANTNYHITLMGHAFSALSQELGDYHFEVQSIRQQLMLHRNSIALKFEGQQLNLHGRFSTADVADEEVFVSLLNVHFSKNSAKIFPVQWHHDKDGLQHHFIVQNLPRSRQSQKLTLDWTGKSLNVRESGSIQVNIPAKQSFKLMKAQAMNEDKRFLRLQFSDVLDENQNLKGLIRLNGKSYSLRVEGNTIRIYHNLTGRIKISVAAAVRSKLGRHLSKDWQQNMDIPAQPPQVRFVGKGVILPQNPVLSIPFEGLNIQSVQVTAFQVFDHNMSNFLQSNKLSGQSNITFVGRSMWRKSIDLGKSHPDQWQRYHLDASELLKSLPGGLFRLTLSINRGDSAYICSEKDNATPVVKELPFQDLNDLGQKKDTSSWDYYENNQSNQQDSWQARKNPCKDAYYSYASGVKSARNFMASNIGLIAKLGDDHQLHVITTDIRTSLPLKGSTIQVYNFQGQKMTEMHSNAEGMSQVTLEHAPFYLLAKHGKEVGYLKVNVGGALPVSHFDVGGEKVRQGIKGYIYAERGVWRPGNDIYLTFVVDDRQQKLPAKHPVSMRLYDPRGKLMQTLNNHSPTGRFYSFKLKTAEDAPTGNWRAEAQLGGMRFQKTLKIATVKPNRLKVLLDIEQNSSEEGEDQLQASLTSQWLHGASASGLNTDVRMRLTASSTHFSTNKNFTFDDPTRPFHGKESEIFKGTLDEKGKQEFTVKAPLIGSAPGMLLAHFSSRVFEKGGDYSRDDIIRPYHPYQRYIGIKLPKGDIARGMLLTDIKQTVNVIAVDRKGKAVDVDDVQISIQKIHWKWWWDKSSESLASYASSSYNRGVAKGNLNLKNGSAAWQFEIKYPAWGRYLVRACDVKGGHCASKTVYIDWPGWAGRAQPEGSSAASRLNIYSDKKEYKAGEVAQIQLPNAIAGRALISIENGTGVLKQQWLSLDHQRKQFSLPITSEMAPNVYVSVTLLQPHADKKSDRPIRLYGVLPIKVVNPSSVLTPIMTTADEYRSKSKMYISVAERKGRAMDYTLAVVDEGLLGLTRFSTPDLHREFFKREALGVSTWDMFDDVVGAYGGKLERLLALGGGSSAKDKEKKKKSRFPPVVRVLGPFSLKAGQTRHHEVTLPAYI